MSGGEAADVAADAAKAEAVDRLRFIAGRLADVEAERDGLFEMRLEAIMVARDVKVTRQAMAEALGLSTEMVDKVIRRARTDAGERSPAHA